MTWKLGILIAGSLSWSDEPYRREWRNKCLNLDRVTPVKAPIRYGRRSRSGTYTMVFAPGCPLGQAKAVECRSPISSMADVIKHAEALWVAECPAEREPAAGERHSAAWGCVALLVNPKSSLPPDFLEQWAERVSQERDRRRGSPTYDSRRYEVGGMSAIGDNGGLQIPWPDRADDSQPLDSVDLLLATATQPTPDANTGNFPAVEAIAQAWNNMNEARYFRSNREHGFHTFQDAEIAALLRV